DVEKQEVRFGDRVIKASVPDGPRNQLVNGTGDSTAVLLEAGAAIEATAGRLPFVKGFCSRDLHMNDPLSQFRLDGDVAVVTSAPFGKRRTIGEAVAGAGARVA